MSTSLLTCCACVPPCPTRTHPQALSGLQRYYAMARGGTALDMSKFFDTNYHYLVPELGPEVLAPGKPSLQPDFSGPLEKLARGQAVVGREHAVPILIGEIRISPAAISCFWRLG